MPDQLRRFAETFEGEVEPPDFELLARESRRRNRAIVIVSGLTAIAVVLGVAVWSRAATHDGSVPPVDRTPTPPASSAPALTLTADQVVDDPSSRLSSLAVSPTDPDVAAGVWWHCASKDCNHGLQAALAVTTDGWRTRSTRLLESFTKPARAHLVVNALSDGRLIVHRVTTYGNPAPAEPALLQPDLTLTPLEEHSGSDVLRDGEAVPATVFVGAGAWAVDPAAHTFRDVGGGHRWTSSAMMPNGIIVASTSENRVAYSADAGATWRFVPDDAVSRDHDRWAVDAARPGTIAVLEGNAGCEAGCPDTLDISRDSGTSWSTVDLGGNIGHLAVITSHGTLLYVGVRPPAAHPRLLRSTADSLGELQVVLGGPELGAITRLVLSESGGRETVTACGDDGVCRRSTDDGRTWSTFAMR